MSPNRNSQPPPTMTWRKASPVLILCAIFDLLRAFFGMFWLFGPALAALYCTSTVNGALGTSIGEVAGTSVGTVCTGAAVAAGVAYGAGIELFGAVMAMATGLMGWLTVGLVLIMSNARIFKENASSLLMMLLGLGASQIPFINALPALTVTTWRLYHTQIAKEKKELQEWHQEQVRLAQREQQQYLMMRRAQEEQDMAAEEIPEEMRRAP